MLGTQRGIKQVRPCPHTARSSVGKDRLGSSTFFFIMVKYLPYLNILNEEKEQMVFWKMKYNPLETVAEK